MIRLDYQPYFQEFRRQMEKFGYEDFRESELLAEFFLSSGWMVEFECERYYGPSFTVSIIPPKFKDHRANGYAVWILMRVFEEKTGKSYGKPTIQNQVNFLVEEKEKVFSDPNFYEAEYAKLNDIKI